MTSSCAIHDAARMGHLYEVERLVEEDPGTVHSLGYGYGWCRSMTALHIATLAGYSHVVSYLLDQGADIDKQEASGQHRTCLYIACDKGDMRMVELFLVRGADPRICGTYGKTPLIQAAIWGFIEVVECLLSHEVGKTTINAQDEDGKTALWWACHQRCPRVARMLLEAGADYSLCARNGSLPVDTARHHGHVECTRLVEVS